MGTERIRLDVHNHIYPQVHIDAVLKHGGRKGWTIRRNPITNAVMLSLNLIVSGICQNVVYSGLDI
ncbi:MAG: hypothetical protein M1368_08005, partial [Thaumarchaeota archaeon]|nr:hypothetical protein [Nitrososphaerota archaeon]